MMHHLLKIMMSRSCKYLTHSWKETIFSPAVEHFTDFNQAMLQCNAQYDVTICHVMECLIGHAGAQQFEKLANDVAAIIANPLGKNIMLFWDNATDNNNNNNNNNNRRNKLEQSFKFSDTG